MIKNILTLAILSTCISSNVFAFNFFPGTKTALKKPSIKTTVNLAKQKADTDYTNFSGTWTGICTSEHDSEPSTVVIHNDEVFLDIDGQDFNLGSIKTESSSDKWSTEHSHMIINWNKERTALILEGSITEYTHSDYPYNDYHSLFNMLAKGTISLDNDKLNFKVETLTFNGITQGEKLDMECNFDRAK
ncbi:hypothetical protein BN59_00037 [Legionella massiliensis]|uniref:Uncharacterized protein n=1 Tax=Legionella massiliensis TaxID=1034943 RepID=A0A078KVH7_9GAMM|nr:hypothetical protein [Legionella massiliensis]CDZ75779.1 hypothetical protein BN59_00037 [Legionella massiliensis]CEE11517.1 hypothetical protein BN1094_00037 [Legionella massiliensis]